MPVGDSFKNNTENTVKLKAAITDNIKSYINEILKEFN